MMNRTTSSMMIGCAWVFIVTAALTALPACAVELTQAGSSPNTVTIANGDSVYIHGIATGHPQNGLQLWIISHNYLKITTIPVNDDNTYEYELKPADTRNLASGQYFFVVQHPMMNGQFDIIYDRASGRIINRQLGSGKDIFTISGSGSLQGPDSAQALVDAISSQNIDDTFATYSFYVNPPAVFISPVGNHFAGDRFTITGSTNLAPGDGLMVEITSSSFAPTKKGQSGEFSGLSRVVQVVQGSGGYNRWSVDIDAATFKPDEYIVKVSGVTLDVTGSAMFNIINSPPPVSVITTTTEPATAAVMVTTQPATASTTPRSPLYFGVVIVALLILVCIKKTV